MKKNIVGLIVKFYFVEFGTLAVRTMYVTAYGASKKKALRNAFEQIFLYRSNNRYTYHEIIYTYEV